MCGQRFFLILRHMCKECVYLFVRPVRKGKISCLESDFLNIFSRTERVQFARCALLSRALFQGLRSHFRPGLSRALKKKDAVFKNVLKTRLRSFDLQKRKEFHSPWHWKLLTQNQLLSLLFLSCSIERGRPRILCLLLAPGLGGTDMFRSDLICSLERHYGLRETAKWLLWQACCIWNPPEVEF